MSFVKSLSLVMAVFSIAACSGAKSMKKGLAGTEGIWLQQDEAEELQKTGKLLSLCEEIKRDPDPQITNARLVEKDGNTYLFHPDHKKSQSTKLGVVKPSGYFTALGAFKESIGYGVVRVRLESDLLIFAFTRGTETSEIAYKRSSVEEIQKYFAAQDECRRAPVRTEKRNK